METPKYTYRFGYNEDAHSGQIEVGIYQADRWEEGTKYRAGTKFGSEASVFIDTQFDYPSGYGGDMVLVPRLQVNQGSSGCSIEDALEKSDTYSQAIQIAQFLQDEINDGLEMKEAFAHVTAAIESCKQLNLPFVYLKATS